MLLFLSYFLLCLFYGNFVCSYPGTYIKHLIVITIYFKLITKATFNLGTVLGNKEQQIDFFFYSLILTYFKYLNGIS